MPHKQLALKILLRSAPLQILILKVLLGYRKAYDLLILQK
jgi:hypothetical protein